MKKTMNRRNFLKAGSAAAVRLTGRVLVTSDAVAGGSGEDADASRTFGV